MLTRSSGAVESCRNRLDNESKRRELKSEFNISLRLICLVVLLWAGLTVSLCLGDVFIGPTQVKDLLFGGRPAGDFTALHDIIWEIRLPRLLIATTIGIALSVSGYVLQTLSRNQLADPYLTGVSSGAALAVAAGMIAGLDFSLVPVAAFAGGLAAGLIVSIMARTAGGLSVTRLLLAGVALSSVCGALITLVITQTGDASRTQGLLFWLAGGIAGRSWQELGPATVYATIGLAGAFLMSKQLRLLSLGTDGARALGLDVARAQWLLLSIAVLLCGAAVSISGLVGFVGLIAPNLSRMFFGRDERVNLIAAALIGGVLVIFSDLAARTLGQGQELPLGTLLALVGGPFFLYLVGMRKGEDRE